MLGKNVSLFVLALLMLIHSSPSKAKNVDLSFNESCTVFRTSIEGKPADGVLDSYRIKLPKYKKALFYASKFGGFDGINQTYTWTTYRLSSLFDDSFKPLPVLEKPVNCGIFMILELMDGDYLAFQPVAVNNAMSWIEVVDDNTIDVKLGTMGVDAVELKNIPVLAYGKGDDLYKVVNDLWVSLTNDKYIKDNLELRNKKVYPEQFNYLGWCSWEHFKKNINEKVLLESVDEIEKSDFPVRWVLVDHGHQTQMKEKLINFEVSPEKFPNGWSTLMSKRSDKIKWFGLWHCMYGNWGGYILITKWMT